MFQSDRYERRRRKQRNPIRRFVKRISTIGILAALSVLIYEGSFSGSVKFCVSNSFQDEGGNSYNQNNAFKLSVISTIVSSVSVVASLVIALTR